MANKTVVLLVHGMGTHEKGQIVKDYKKALTDSARRCGIANLDFINDVDYREFNYSDYFDVIRKQFAENNAARAKGFKFLVGKGFDDKLIKQLSNFESKFGKDDFFYTHWLDVILYGTMYYGEKVRLDFITRFESLRKAYGHRNMHVVAHSLGTAVVHDALGKYYRADSDPFDDIPDLKTGNFNLASIWTFANVSKMVNLLNGLTDPDHSTVVTGPQGCTNGFVNIRHQYDPFTWFKPYNRKMDYKLTFVNKVIRKVNTHDFYEYVTDPRVSKELLNIMYGVEVTDAEFDRGVDEHKKERLAGPEKKLKKLVDEARQSPTVVGLEQAIKRFEKIVAEIEKRANP